MTPLPDSQAQPTTPLPDPQTQPTISVEMAGRYLGLGRASAYAAASRGDIPTIRIGRRLVVPTAAVRRMVQLDSEPVPAA